MKICPKNRQKGFTLIELLVVIGILAILLAIVLIAVNPTRQFSQANNTKRQSDVSAILNAIGQYTADNKGTMPASITTSVQNISKTAADICSDIVPTYMSALPSDPKASNGGTAITDCASSYNTDYTVVKDTSGRITVSMLNANVELNATVSATR